MKSFTSQFMKLNKGLRRFNNSPVNSEELVECFNLAPDEAGLELHEQIVLPSGSYTWPGTTPIGDAYNVFQDLDGMTFEDLDGYSFVDN